MPERIELALKITCLALAALLIYQFSQFLSRWNPLRHASIPALPALSGRTNSEAGGKATNAPGAQLPKPAKAETNSSPTSGRAETNAVASQTHAATATNPDPSKVAESRMPMALAPPMMMLGIKAPDLPPAVEARVDRIAQSEILAPFIRPLPMALLGIADDRAFLRAANGQMGVIKEGGEVGGIKLLRIGTNRVLIELDGQQKEMTIFSGYGGQSLLPNSTPPSQ